MVHFPSYPANDCQPDKDLLSLDSELVFAGDTGALNIQQAESVVSEKIEVGKTLVHVQCYLKFNI